MTALAREQKDQTKRRDGISILVLAPQPFFQNRGTPIAVRLLVEELARLGHEVHLLVFHEGQEVAIKGVTIHRIPKIIGVSNIPPSLSWKKLVCDGAMFFRLFSLNRKYRFDLIHCVEEAVYLAFFAKPLLRRPYIYDMDSSLAIQIVDKLQFLSPVKGMLDFFERAAVAGSDGVVAVCTALEEIARGYAPDKEIVTLEDISLLEEGEQTDEDLRRSLGISGPILLYVGNLEKYQGIDLLLEAYYLACIEGDAQGELVIIGGTKESIASYQAKALELGIRQGLHFCGPRPFSLLGEYLSQADILLSPRIQGNNTPMKLYSYLDSGRAVLATRLDTHTQVLTDAISCLVDPDPPSMAEGMTRLLAEPTLRKELGMRGKSLAQEKYSRAVYRKKLAEFYGKILTRLGLPDKEKGGGR